MNEVLGALLGIGFLVVPAIAFLAIGDFLRKRRRLGPECRFNVTVHVIAIIAAALGVAECWMSFASDHPLKWRSIWAPFVMVALVYFFAFLMGQPMGAPGAGWWESIRAKLRR